MDASKKNTIMLQAKENIKYALLIFLAGLSIHSFATNVEITNLVQVGVDANNHRIEFDLSWDDSWKRDNQEPNNYDGVWIFVKYRDCNEKAGGNPGSYKHCWLSTTASDHTISSSSDPLTVDVGLTDVSGTDRGMGVFIYRTNNGIGDVSATTVSLLWRTGDHSPAEDATINNYDIEVHAIEMVWVPTDSFYLGDGISTYFLRDPDNSNRPIYVNSASMNWERVDHQTLRKNGTQNIPNEYPNGFDGFWIMKYEISQEQYLRFLNTLSRAEQNYRTWANVDASQSSVNNVYVMSNTSSMTNRNGICCTPSVQVGGNPIRFRMDYNGNRIYNENDDGANIASNFISGEDVLAYLDWAALRPLTEFEYEKAARGPHAKPFGYTDQKAWGLATINEVTGILNEGEPDERPSNLGVEGICVYNNNANVQGPLRCGFASTTTTQNQYTCGASYYGVFEMTGNVSEFYMSVRFGASPYVDNFQGRAGDGLIDQSSGRANQAGWPQGATAVALDGNYCQYRGGDWYLGPSVNAAHIRYYINISARYQRNATNGRYDWSGGRGGRYVTK